MDGPSSVPPDVAGVSIAVRHRRGLPGIFGGLSVARRLRLPSMWAPPRLPFVDPALLAMRLQSLARSCSCGTAGKILGPPPHGGNPGLQSCDDDCVSHQERCRRTTVYTDGLKSFDGLSQASFNHVPRKQPSPTEVRKGAKSVVPLADRAIGNLQQWLLGTHHGVSRAQLQVYLDEFVFRHNRRKTPMAAFHSRIGVGREPTSLENIRGGSDLAAEPNEADHNIMRSAETTG